MAKTNGKSKQQIKVIHIRFLGSLLILFIIALGLNFKNSANSDRDIVVMVAQWQSSSVPTVCGGSTPPHDFSWKNP